MEETVHRSICDSQIAGVQALDDGLKQATFGGLSVNEPRLLEGLQYWQSRCGTRWAPSRADIDPVGLRTLLPYVYLIDVLPAPRQFRMRLVGTNVREFAGQDFTGRMIDETIYGKQAKMAIDNLVTLTEKKKPLLLRGLAFYEGQHAWQRFEALQLPLISDQSTVDIIMGINVAMHISATEHMHAPKANLDRFEMHFMDGGL